MNPALWKIALSMVDGIGSATAKKLVRAFGSAEGVYEATFKELINIRGVQEQVARQIAERTTLAGAEEELRFTEDRDIRVFLAGDADYPHRLRQCADAPAVLYVRGNFNPDHPRILGVVGTRRATDRGKELCEELIAALAEEGILIISGMAYGVDYCAHRAAVKSGLPTAAVFAHGLDIVYPSAHRKTAEEMLQLGGWITEFKSRTAMDRNFFPRRNRIVAGLCDGLLVIESDKKGGSLITADIANSYNREVMAVPGRPGDVRAAGCNWLIKTNRAAMVENATDLLRQMNWERSKKKSPVQLSVFPALSDEELELARCLQQSGPVSIDSLADLAGKPMQEVSFLLLNLELEGVVKAMPGKRYSLKKPLGSY
jgi:DNA processing protein